MTDEFGFEPDNEQGVEPESPDAVGFVADSTDEPPDDDHGFTAELATAPNLAMDPTLPLRLATDPRAVGAELAETDRDEQVRAWFDVSKAKEPNRYAAIQALKRKTGAPLEVIEKGFDQFKTSAARADFDPRRWRTDNPDQYEALLEQPGLAPIVHGDEKVSKFFLALRAVARSDSELPWYKRWRSMDPVGTLMATVGVAATPGLEPHLESLRDKNIAYQESQLRGWDAVTDTFDRASRQEELNALGAKQILYDADVLMAEGDDDPWESRRTARIEKARQASYENWKRRQLILEELGLQPDYQQGKLTQLGMDVAQGLSSQITTLKGQGAGALLGGAIGLALTKSPGGAQAGAMLFGATGGALVSAVQETGGAYPEFLETVDADGNPMDPRVAIGAAALYGAFASGVEFASFGPMAEAFGLKGLAADAAKAKIKEALTDATKRGILLRFGLAWAKSAAAEGGEGAAQSLLQDGAQWAGSSVSAGLTRGEIWEKQKFDVGGTLERMAAAGWLEAVGAGFGLGGAQAVTNITSQLALHERSRRAAVRAAGIVGLGESEAARSMPIEISAMVERASAGSGEKVTHLYVDTQRFVEAVQKLGADVNQVARELMGEDGSKRLAQALAEYADTPSGRATLEVPLAEFMEKWGGKPLTKELVPDITTKRGLMTPRSETLYQGDIGSLTDELVASYESLEQGGEVDPALMPTPSERAFVDQLRKQLAATQKEMTPQEVNLSVATWRAIYRTMASRSKVPAEEIFKAVVSVQNDPGPTAAPASLERLEQSFADMPDDQARAGAFVRDLNTNLYSERGADLAPRDPARPMLAEFDIPGKFLNLLGQGALDGAYRQMAGALVASGISDGAKIGGSIRAWVRDAAQASEIAAAMQGAVDPRVVVTHAVAAVPEGTKLKEAMDLSSAEHKRVKGELYAAKKIGHRKGIPSALAREGDPEIALEGDMPGIDPDSPEAQAVFERAVGEMAEAGQIMRSAALPAPAPLTPAHEAAYALRGGVLAFDDIYRKPSGLLSDDGKQAAMKANPQPFIASADLDYFREMNDAFGAGWKGADGRPDPHEPVDAINQYFGEVVAALGGGEFDAWNPHGDEYGGHGADEAQLDRFFRMLKAITKDKIFYLGRDDGSIVVLNGLSFAHGIGESADTADDALNAAKRDARAERKRTGEDGKPKVFTSLESAREFHRLLESERGRRLGWVDVRALVGRRREGLARRRAGERLSQKVALLTRHDRATLKQQLRKLESIESKTLAGLTVQPFVSKTAEPSLASIDDAYDQIFPSGSRDDSKTEQADSAYLRARDGRGEMPGPFAGGESGIFDPVNEHLHLRGKKKVSSGRDAFARLIAEKRGTLVEKVEHAIRYLSQVEGFENIRLPDEFAEQRLEEDARLEEFALQDEADAEIEAGGEQQGIEDLAEPDTSFEPGFYELPQEPTAEETADEEHADEDLEQGPFELDDERPLYQANALRTGRETLPGVQESVSTRELGEALQDRQRRKYGVIAKDDRSPEASRRIARWMADEVMFEMKPENRSGSGVGWYSEKYQNALDTFGDLFPELKTDQAARDIFTAMVAVTSDGQRPGRNFMSATEAYEAFRKTGRVAGAAYRGNIAGNLQKIDEMLREMGPEAMATMLMEKLPYSEFAKILRADAKLEGKNPPSNDFTADTMIPRAAVIFGPKLGFFYANLMGASGYLTMDRWWSRTFNRYRGQLIPEPTRPVLERFKRLIGKPGLSDDRTIAAVVPYQRSYEAKGFRRGTEIEKAANTIYKAAFSELQDVPFNATDRKFMIETAERAQAQLAERGVEMSVADIQATLWYYEKRLYAGLGAIDSGSFSYEEIAKRIVAEKAAPGGVDRPRGPAVQGRAGRRLASARGPEGTGPDTDLADEVETLYQDGPDDAGTGAVSERSRRLMIDSQEDQIRGLPRERAIIVHADGSETVLDGEVDHVPIPPETIRAMRADGNVIFTHNHPRNTVLSDADLILAVFANVAEMRATNPRGGAWVLRRPESGWGVGDTDTTAQTRYAEGEMLEFSRQVRSAFNNGVAMATTRMDALIRESGGIPGSPSAKGYSDEAWHTFVSEEVSRFYNQLASEIGAGWRVEFESADARSERMARARAEAGSGTPAAVRPEAVVQAETPDDPSTVSQPGGYGSLIGGDAPAADTLNQPTDRYGSEPGPRWHSAVERAVGQAKQEKNTPAAWLALVRKAPGVKKEEIEWLGLEQWLGEQTGSVTRAQVAEYVKAHQIEVTERQLSTAETLRTESADRDAIQQAYRDGKAEWAKLYGPGINEAYVTLAFADAAWGNFYQLGNFESALEMAEKAISREDKSPGAAQTWTPLRDAIRAARDRETGAALYESYTLGDHTPGSYREILFYAPGTAAQQYTSPHFEGGAAAGVLAHARISAHKTEEGPLLFVEEVQSDLHQKGRDEGYERRKGPSRREGLAEAKRAFIETVTGAGYASMSADLMANRFQTEEPTVDAVVEALGSDSTDRRSVERQRQTAERILPAAQALYDLGERRIGQERRVPNAPFKAGWDELVAKRMIRWAAENDYTQLGWTTGEQQAERYDLTDRIDSLSWNRTTTEDGQTYALTPYRVENGHRTAMSVLMGEYTADNLPEIVGKEIARQITSSKEDSGTLQGVELSIGGEGMKAFYDQRMVSIFRKLVQKHGGEVKKQRLIGLPDRDEDAWQGAYDDASRQGADRYEAEEYADSEHPRLVNRPEVWTVTIPESLRETVLEEGMPLFQESGVGGTESIEEHRGLIDIVKHGARRSFHIFLTKHADLSTFLHESSHAYLEMFGDLAEHEQADVRAKAHYADALKWLGVEQRSQLQRSHKEKWARGFEAYLRAGKAPSPALAEAFTAYKLWLEQVYLSLDVLDVELDDNIRGVFDRLLATDQEIKRMRLAAGMDVPLWKSHIEAGLSPEEWDRYIKLRLASTTHTAMVVQREVAQAQLRATRAFRSSEFKKLEKQAAAEWERRADVRAWDFVRSGKSRLEDGTVVKNTAMGKLDRDTLHNLLGADHPLVKRLRGRLSATGEHPSTVAQGFGFKTGRAMLEALAAMPERDAVVRARAEEIMRERHPEIDGEVGRLAEYVQETLHNAGTSDWLVREWGQLKRLASLYEPGTPIRDMPLEAVKQAARDIVQRRAIGRINLGQTLNSERAAAENAALEAAKGNYRKAYLHKQQQLLHHHIWRELSEADKTRRRFRALGKMLSEDAARGRLGTASPAHRDVVDALLEGLGFHGRREQDQPRQSLEALVAAMEENGDTVGFDIEAFGKILAKPKPWRELTVAEMGLALDALRNIKKSATNRNTAIVDGERRNRGHVKAELLEEARRNLPAKPPPASSVAAMSMAGRGLALAGAFDGYMLKPETMLAWLGGESIDSMWHRAIIKPLQAAKTVQADLMRKHVRPVVEAFRDIPAGVRARLMETVDGKALFPTHREDLQAPTIRLELLMMALHRGNESNIDRLTKGRNITLEQVDAAIATLTREELAWVQSIWNANESLWPLARELEERDSGLPPPKIKATPFVVRLADGTEVQMAGGYFPAVYDRRVEEVGEKQAARTVADLMDGSYTRPGTSQSHLQRRAQEFSGALSLDPLTIQSHLMKVTHDIAFRETIRSVGSLVMDADVQAVLKQRLGDERSRVFLQWLKDIGRMEAAQADAHAGVLGRAVRSVRSNMVLGVLGYAIDNFIADTTSVLVAPISTDLRSKHMAAALFDSAKNWTDTRAFVLEKSGEVRKRADGMRAEIDRQIRSMTRGKLGRGVDWIRDHAFWVAEKIDEGVSTVLWLGRYRQALKEGRPEADAVELANRVLRQALPGASVVDMAAIQRDKGFLGASVAFHGYMNVLYNLDRRIWQPVVSARGAGATAAAVPRAMAQYVALMAVTRILAELLVGRGPEPEDDESDEESWLGWMLRKMLVGAVSPVPFVGGMVESWALGRDPSVRSAPLFSIMDTAGKAAARAWREGEDGEKAAWDLMRAAGLLFGIPTRPVRWAQYALTQSRGDDIGEAASGLLYGERERQPANVFNLTDPPLMQ